MIATATPIPTREEYTRMAQEYMDSLPLEEFMEGEPQAWQRQITMDSFLLIRARRPEVLPLNDLLVQYPLPSGKTGRVVPDNMVVLNGEPRAKGLSYNTAHEKGEILIVMEYVLPDSDEKDYKLNVPKYRDGLKARYYLIFDPATKRIDLNRLVEGEYVPVEPDIRGRLAIPEISVEVALQGGYMRFWFEGELVDMPDEMLAKWLGTRELLSISGQKLEVAEQERNTLKADLEEEKKQKESMAAELAKLREEMAKYRA